MSSYQGYDEYTSTAGSWAANARTPSKKLTLNPAAEQYFECTMAAGADLQGIGLHNNLGSAVTTTATYFAYPNISGTGYWKMQTGGMTVNNATLAAAAGDRARFRLTTANTLYFEVSKNGGSTWTTVATKTGITDAELFPRIGCGNIGSTYQLLKCNGVATA